MPAHKPKLPSPPQDDPAESKRFIDMAREVEADETPGVFDQGFDRVIGRHRHEREKVPPASRAAARKNRKG